MQALEGDCNVFRFTALAADRGPARRHGGGGIFLGLLALADGIARYVFLGQLLARVFEGAPWQDLLTPALCAAAMVLLLGGLRPLAHRAGQPLLGRGAAGAARPAL